MSLKLKVTGVNRSLDKGSSDHCPVLPVTKGVPKRGLPVLVQGKVLASQVKLITL